MFVKKLVIITGLSGSGKSCALHALEDEGFFTVDNLPAAMLSQLVALLEEYSQKSSDGGIGVVMDMRSPCLLEDLPRTVAVLKERGVDVQILFLEASDDSLLHRYSMTRRRHPLGSGSTLLAGITEERLTLTKLRSQADRIIDTTCLSSEQLRKEICLLLSKNPAGLEVIVSSFGFKYGVARDADFVFDVRFLSNPYYENSLRNLSGRDAAVQEYILADPLTVPFLTSLSGLFESVIPSYHKSRKNYLHIAIGCTGGHHRSVFIAEWLCAKLSHLNNVVCRVVHRDLDRDGESRK